MDYYIALFLTIMYLIIINNAKRIFINFLLFQLRYFKKNIYKDIDNANFK